MVKSSLDAVAKNLVISLTDYFDIPFLLPQPSRSGQVDVDWGVLNIRPGRSWTPPSCPGP